MEYEETPTPLKEVIARIDAMLDEISEFRRLVAEAAGATPPENVPMFVEE